MSRCTLSGKTVLHHICHPLQRQCVRPPQWIAQPATCCTSASCDLEPLILAECKLLGKRMCVCQTIHVSQYQWADPCPWRPELVLGADLLYDPGVGHAACTVCSGQSARCCDPLQPISVPSEQHYHELCCFFLVHPAYPRPQTGRR